MTGKLLVIDGLDGSGKSTQAERLAQRLREDGREVTLISYPDYEKPSSTLVRMYLSGEFSDKAGDVNAYAASTFYAVDRYAGYMQHWKALYEQGHIIIASRYVSSNAIHQMVKLPQCEWDGFLQWLSDFEFEKLGLPKPDGIFFLDMSRAVADQLITARYEGDEEKRDLHERDLSYLYACTASATYAADKQGWQVVRCCDGRTPYPMAQITDALYKAVRPLIEQ